jgi:hypothetical protein
MKTLCLTILFFCLSLSSVHASPHPEMGEAAVTIELLDQTAASQNQPRLVCYDENWTELDCTDPRVVTRSYRESVTVTAPAPAQAPQAVEIRALPPTPQPAASKHDFALGAIVGVGAVAANYDPNSNTSVGDSGFNPFGGLRFMVDNLNLDLWMNKNDLGPGWDARVGYFVLPIYHRNGIRAVGGIGGRQRDAFQNGFEKYFDLGGEATWSGDNVGFSLTATWNYWFNIPATAMGTDGKVYSTLAGPGKLTPSATRISANIFIRLKGIVHDPGVE